MFNKWLLLLLLFPGTAFALSSDRDQPIQIESDTADLDEGRDLSIYRGNVRVTQGSLKLFADKLTVYGLQDPKRMVATGKKARFRQRPDGKDKDIEGEALSMEYLLNKDLLYLIDKAVLKQEDNTFRSQRIQYNIERSKVQAGGSNRKDQKKERVKVTIQPKKRSQ